MKAEIGAEAAKDHPARYALCEITALEDESLVFEPIYRILTDCDAADVSDKLAEVTAPGTGEQTITVCIGGKEEVRHFTAPTHALVVGTLQDFVDGYVKDHAGAACDYIHGEEDLRTLAKEDGRVDSCLILWPRRICSGMWTNTAPPPGRHSPWEKPEVSGTIWKQERFRSKNTACSMGRQGSPAG